MTHSEKIFDETIDFGPVVGFLHRPAATPQAGLVLTHGAGSNSLSPLLVALAQAFCGVGWMVLRCDLPFRQMWKTGPPRGSAVRDQQGLQAAVALLRRYTPAPVFLGGHSYGGRMASMLAADHPGLVENLLLLSYPLHPPKQPASLRTAHFPQLTTPALFVHGARDGFGTTEELEAALRLIPGRTELLSIPGAGHELMTRRNQEELPKTIVAAFQQFLSRD